MAVYKALTKAIKLENSYRLVGSPASLLQKGENKNV